MFSSRPRLQSPARRDNQSAFGSRRRFLVPVLAVSRSETSIAVEEASKKAHSSHRSVLASFAATAAAALVATSVVPPPLPLPLPPLPLLSVRPALAFLSSSRRVPPADIVPSLRPDPLSYDAGDPRLREAANALQLALNAESLEREEAAWTAVVEKYEPLVEITRRRGEEGKEGKGVEGDRYSDNAPAPWAEEIVSRAYGNRGNARARAGKADAALADLDRAIELAPWATDPVLNRGVVLENSGRLDEAARDYRAVIDATAGKDASPYNNLGNVMILEATRLESTSGGAEAARAKYREAAESFGTAVRLSPSFSFAAANRAVALFAAGDDDDAALKELRRLNRRFPNFDEARAAAAGILWARGERAAAEGEWNRVEDGRYRDISWLVNERHWPPRLVEAASALLEVRAVR